MRVSILKVADSSGGAVVQFMPDSSEERALVAEAARRAKEKQHDGPYALSRFLVDLTDRRSFDFTVT